MLPFISCRKCGLPAACPFAKAHKKQPGLHSLGDNSGREEVRPRKDQYWVLFCGKYIVDSLVTYWEELDDLVWRTLHQMRSPSSPRPDCTAPAPPALPCLARQLAKTPGRRGSLRSGAGQLAAVVLVALAFNARIVTAQHAGGGFVRVTGGRSVDEDYDELIPSGLNT